MEYVQYVIFINGKFDNEFKTPIVLNSEEEKKVKGKLLSLSLDTLNEQDSIDDLISIINDEPSSVQVTKFNSKMEGYLSIDKISVILGGIQDEGTESQIYDVIDSSIIDVIGSNSDVVFDTTLEEIIEDIRITFDDEDILYSDREFTNLELELDSFLAFGRMDYTPSIEILKVGFLLDFIKGLINEVKEYNNEDVNQLLVKYANDVTNYISQYKVHFEL